MTSELDTSLSAVATALRASTVRVHDTGGRGSGSGVVWSADGLIVTNAHVVRGTSATVETAHRTYQAQLLSRDPHRDLAAVRIDAAAELVPAAVRDSDSVVAGELVVAAGNPLGFVGAIAAGLVHRCNARWVIADVRLAPGNSGGPLGDAEGRVVGINSMVAGGLALAVPTSAVRSFLGAGSGRKLGVRLVPVRVGGTECGERALLIAGIDPGSLAERSGLMLGDTIVHADVATLQSAASIDVLRGGRSLTVRLAAASEGTRAA